MKTPVTITGIRTRRRAVRFSTYYANQVPWNLTGPPKMLQQVDFADASADPTHEEVLAAIRAWQVEPDHSLNRRALAILAYQVFEVDTIVDSRSEEFIGHDDCTSSTTLPIGKYVVVFDAPWTGIITMADLAADAEWVRGFDEHEPPQAEIVRRHANQGTLQQYDRLVAEGLGPEASLLKLGGSCTVPFDKATMEYRPEPSLRPVLQAA